MTENLHELPSAWKLAMEREQASHDLYLRMSQTAIDAAVRSLFETLAAQEAKHRQLLEEEYRRVFEADMDRPRGRSGTFEHGLHAGASPVGFSWWPWEEDTFRLARELDVPILLDISATWCHWCHVMDETYRDAEVGALINAEFIAIRVDTDERPDINARYNMGGWPTTAFLTPDGEPLTGATYLTPDQFVRTGRQVADYYHSHKVHIEERAKSQDARLRVAETAPVASGRITSRTIKDVASAVSDAFDHEYGGLGAAPKFPQVDALALALDEYERTGDLALGEHVRRTLHHMAQGGIFDAVAGGFFRYATSRDWSAPHYEKMAEDNAQLLGLYLAAAQVLAEPAFLKTASRVADYVMSAWYDPSGFFYASQDADESYYVLDAAGRGRRSAPFVDKTSFASHNAMMASAMLRAGLLLDRRDLTEAALSALDFIWTKLHRPGAGLDHFRRNGQGAGGFLVDQVWGAMALLDAYERVGESRYLAQARELMAYVSSGFSAGKGAGFFDTAGEPGALGRLKVRDVPIQENAIVALVSMRLYALTGDEAHRQAAESALTPFAVSYKDYSFGAARYASAVHAFVTPPMQIIIVGSAEDPGTDDLRRAALRVAAPNRVLQVVDPTWEPERLARLGYPATPPLRAYICTGVQCVKPTDRADEIESIVSSLVSPWKQVGQSPSEGPRP